MPPRKDTAVCRRCGEILPREAFDLCHLSNGRIRLYTHCRACRTAVGWYARGARQPTLPPNPSGLCLCGCGQTTPIARNHYPAMGIVKGEHTRFVVGHRSTIAVAPQEYIIDTETGCWVWQRGIDKHGRGVASANGRAQRAHRVIYERYKGTIPPGLELDHLCCNPLCVNPDHTEPVTHAENFARDRARRQIAARLWLLIRQRGHAGILRIDDEAIGTLEIENGVLRLV